MLTDHVVSTRLHLGRVEVEVRPDGSPILRHGVVEGYCRIRGVRIWDVDGLTLHVATRSSCHKPANRTQTLPECQVFNFSQLRPRVQQRIEPTYVTRRR